MENIITRQEFLQRVVNAVKEMSDVPINARVTDIVLNNGKRDCVQVDCDDWNTCINVGVDSYYKAFCDGDISAVMNAAKAIIQAKEEADVQEGILQEVMNYEQAKDMLMCRLVNTGLNHDMLNRGPSIPFHDLSITFYLMLDGEKCLIAGITNTLIAKWNISIAELFKDALANMQAKSPAEIQSIFEVITGKKEALDDDLENAAKAIGEPIPYVLTNKDKFMGAAVVLYPGMLESCAEKMGGDYYLLPSSIHEFLLAPVSVMPPDEIQTMIRTINQTEVAPEEVLADHAYLYSAAKKRLIIV